jgi:hypothetical protein
MRLFLPFRGKGGSPDRSGGGILPPRLPCGLQASRMVFLTSMYLLYSNVPYMQIEPSYWRLLVPSASSPELAFSDLQATLITFRHKLSKCISYSMIVIFLAPFYFLPRTRGWELAHGQPTPPVGADHIDVLRAKTYRVACFDSLAGLILAGHPTYAPAVAGPRVCGEGGNSIRSRLGYSTNQPASSGNSQLAYPRTWPLPPRAWSEEVCRTPLKSWQHAFPWLRPAFSRLAFTHKLSPDPLAQYKTGYTLDSFKPFQVCCAERRKSHAINSRSYQQQRSPCPSQIRDFNYFCADRHSGTEWSFLETRNHSRNRDTACSHRARSLFRERVRLSLIAGIRGKVPPPPPAEPGAHSLCVLSADTRRAGSRQVRHYRRRSRYLPAPRPS